MNIKIQGGGHGVYANTGSCSGVANYLTHEASELGFFRGADTNIPIGEVVTAIDSNKAKLCRDDAKFFVITISPSAAEIRAMGSTDQEREENFRKYAETCMDMYASGFKNGLTGDDLLYFGRIHRERKKRPQKGKEGVLGLHMHIVMSRKDIHNKKKISPQTNIKDGARGGKIKTGFCRDAFYQQCETAFDQMFDFRRSYKEGYHYQNMRKNGSAKDLFMLGVAEARLENRQADRELATLHQSLESAIDNLDFGTEASHIRDNAIDAGVSSLVDGILALFSVNGGGGYVGGEDPARKRKKRNKGLHM